MLIALLVPIALATLAFMIILARAALASRATPSPEALMLSVIVNFFDALGIDPRKQLVAPDGRPIEILDKGEPVNELFS